MNTQNKENTQWQTFLQQEAEPLCVFHCSKTTTPANTYIAHYQQPTPHLPHLHLQLLQMTIPSKTMQRMTNSSIYNKNIIYTAIEVSLG